MNAVNVGLVTFIIQHNRIQGVFLLCKITNLLIYRMKLQPECISQIAEIIFQTRSNVQAKTMYQERRWRNEEGSNFRTCRYSSIGFRCVWKKCCNGKQFRFGCFNGIGILAGGKWTESNPCEPGNKFVSGVTEEYPVRWGEQLGQDTSFGDASFGDTSFRRAS